MFHVPIVVQESKKQHTGVPPEMLLLKAKEEEAKAKVIEHLQCNHTRSQIRGARFCETTGFSGASLQHETLADWQHHR